MILRNPTDNELSVQIKGSVFTVAAQGTISVDDETGKYWLTLHAFLEVESEESEESNESKDEDEIEEIEEKENTDEDNKEETEESKKEPEKKTAATKE